MAENLDLTDINIVGSIITSIEKSEERDRKEYTFNSWQIYSGNQKPYVQDELQRIRPKSWKTYTISDVSVSKMVVDKLSKAYKQQPKRSVGGDVTKLERLEDIYKEGNHKVQLPYADTINNMHKYVLMWVNYNDDDERYQFMALQPYEYSIVRDKQTGELTAVILQYANRDMTAGALRGPGNFGDGVDDLIAESQSDSSAQSKVYAMWSKENFVVVVSENKKIKTAKGESVEVSVTYVDDPKNQEKVNRLGMIPFVFVPKEPTIDFPTPSPLSEQSVTYNVLESENLTSGIIQGTGTMVIKYPEKFEGKFKNLTQGLTTAIKVPQSDNPQDRETDVSFINPGPDLSGQRENANGYMRKVLAEHGITSSQGAMSGEQNFSSGLERMIANADVQGIIEMNQELYVDMEKKMFEIIKAWERFLQRTVFSEDDELGVKFVKPKLLISDSEVLANVEKMLMLGLIEEHEKFMIIDPNMDESEAKDKLERVKKSRMGGLIGNRPRQDLKDSGSGQAGPKQGAGQPEE